MCVADPWDTHPHDCLYITHIFNVHPHTHTCTYTQQSTWTKLPDVPYCHSAVCVVDGVLLAIGGAEEDSSKQTSAIYALHPVDQKWQHVGDMPFECAYVDTLLLSGGRLLLVDAYMYSQRVLRVTVEGKPYKCYGQYY